MITPTRTVCTCIMEDGYTYRGARRFKLTPSVEKRITEIEAWGSVKRVIVREEPVEQYHPLMFHTKDLSDLKIEPGEVKRYSLCNKNFNPLNPCACGDCGAVLNFFSNLKELPL